MTRLADPFDGPVELDPWTTERLLLGAIAPEDAPPGYEGVARLVEAARRPASAAEVAGVDAAVLSALVVQQQLRDVEPSPTSRVERASRLVKVKVASVVFVGTMVGTSGLAAAGVLPAPLQHAAAKAFAVVGIHVPDPNHGSEVSDTARSTESGPGKGKIVSSVARGDRGSSNGPGGASQDDHGKSDGPHGKSDGPHGKSDGPHGKSDEPHGKSDEPHGKSDEPHGKSDEPHGKSDDPHGAPTDPGSNGKDHGGQPGGPANDPTDPGGNPSGTTGSPGSDHGPPDGTQGGGGGNGDGAKGGNGGGSPPDGSDGEPSGTTGDSTPGNGNGGGPNGVRA